MTGPIVYRADVTEAEHHELRTRAMQARVPLQRYVTAVLREHLSQEGLAIRPAGRPTRRRQKGATR